MANFPPEEYSTRLERAKNVYDGPDEDATVGDLYDSWEDEYEQDMHAIDYVGPQVLAAKVRYYSPDDKDIHILDVGCGTGNVARELKKLGYTTVDGVDASSMLLCQARKRKLYRNTIHAFVGGDPLDLDDNTYDAVIGSGILHTGHLPADGIKDLYRLVKPGGYFMMLGNYDAWQQKEHLHIDMLDELTTLETDKKWRRVEWSIMDDYCHYDEETPGLFFVYTKL